MPEFLDSRISNRVVERNLQTRDLLTYASHRQHTMKLLSAAAADVAQAESASISILGAGNCLDIDLRALTKWFRTISLLDLDRTAVEHGPGTQLPDDDAEAASWRGVVRLIAPCDLAAPLASLRPEDFADSCHVDRICDALVAPFEPVPVDLADVVVSTCLLSQMIDGLALLSSHEHPQFVSLLQALRRGHFRRMLQLLKPGGQGIFISDLVSSESTPVLQEVSEPSLPQLLARCLSSGNFFSGLNPGIVVKELTSCSELCSECCDIQVQAPWRWQMGPRIYAVYAVTFRRRPGEASSGK